jgi:hypothetical protein
MLIPLVCTQCGGKLEVENSQVFGAGDTVIVLNDQTFKCPHCGVKYLPGEKIKSGPPKKAVVTIAGNLNGNIVIGDGNVLNQGLRPPELTDEIPQPRNPTSNSQAAPQSGRVRWILAGVILVVIILALALGYSGVIK